MTLNYFDWDWYADPVTSPRAVSNRVILITLLPEYARIYAVCNGTFLTLSMSLGPNNCVR
jgi:hypothetical protein